MTTRRQISVDMTLPEWSEKRIGLSLPAPINDRLDDLVTLVEKIGEPTSCKEPVASLIFGAPPAGEDLAWLLHANRRAKAWAARLSSSSVGGATVPIQSHRPGPRPRRRLC
ncbi:hypothetical protein ACQEVC_12620 [Plantactinospora sp. CA-294935]|uniref:hypothetical protein n=1 Tax=Plantactinospora sp. CA-294935 TaxID=3240012 RepID=UPI003D9225BD